MVIRYPAAGIVFLCCVLLHSATALAQPNLPDFAGSVDKGMIVLSWNCQYKGVKSVSVLRSTDGLSNFTVVGTVANLDKGLQVFVDGHPAAGKNCYKLGIVFRSGLKWSSNSNCYIIDSSTAAQSVGLPPNDALQKLIVTQNVPGGQVATVNAAKKDNPENEEEDDTDSSDAVVETPKYAQNRTTEPPKVSVSYRDDPALSAAKPSAPNDIQPQQGKKIVLSFQGPDENSSHLVRSRFLSTDPSTGNIIMNLPDEVAAHHYSIKFFDDKNNMITEVPHIHAAKIIIDKRNFQHKGTYKFNLRRDAVELEEGFLTIVP